jgi:hypothetical protein
VTQTAVTGAGANTGTLTVSVASTTYFGSFGGAVFTAQGQTTEARAQTKMDVAGTLSNLYAVMYTNGCTNAPTLKSRVAGADGNLLVSLGTTTGTLSDSTHSDSVSTGALYCYTVITGASTVSLGVGSVAAQLATAAAQAFCYLSGFGSGT